MSRGFADADGVSWSTRERRRLYDLAFIAWVRAAQAAELERAMILDRLHHGLPTWRRVAIGRRLAKLAAQPVLAVS